MLLRTVFCLTVLLWLFVEVDGRHDRYMVRKGGRLDRLQKRTLSEWKKAHRRPKSNRHKRRRHERDGSMHIEHVLAHMDSFVRPRFGR